MSQWYNLELPVPRLRDPYDKREMARFVAALSEKFADLYTYGLGGGSAIWDYDMDTGVQTEESADEDTIRFDAAGTQVASADVDQFAAESGIKLGLEGCAGDTYFKYNSVNGVIDTYVNNDVSCYFSTAGIYLNSDDRVSFDGLGNNTKVLWNTSSLYWEIWIQGELRAQF